MHDLGQFCLPYDFDGVPFDYPQIHGITVFVTGGAIAWKAPYGSVGLSEIGVEFEDYYKTLSGTTKSSGAVISLG